jgi:hypothetical protein
VRPPAIVLILLVGLASAGMILTACGGESGADGQGLPGNETTTQQAASTPASPTRTAAPTPSSSSPGIASPGGALVYLQGTKILSSDLRSGRKHLIADVHSADVSASQGGHWLAYVVPRRPSGAPANGDFVEHPELHLLDLTSGDDVTVGPGFAPLWRPAGDELAYLVPSGPRTCDGESCRGEAVVMIAAPRQTPRSLAEPGRWHLLAWAGDRVLASNERNLRRTFALSSVGAGIVAIHLPPNQIWDASSSGSTLIVVAPDGLEYVEAKDGVPTGAMRVLHTGGTVGDGAWSAGSERLAAVLSRGNSKLFLLSPGRAPVVVPKSTGALGNVVWNRAGDELAFVALASGNPGRLQALACRVTPQPPSCRRLFTWTQGVSLLKLEVQ